MIAYQLERRREGILFQTISELDGRLLPRVWITWFAISPFGYKLVLQHDQVPFPGTESSSASSAGRKEYQRGFCVGNGGFLGGKDTHPA